MISIARHVKFIKKKITRNVPVFDICFEFLCQLRHNECTLCLFMSDYIFPNANTHVHVINFESLSSAPVSRRLCDMIHVSKSALCGSFRAPDCALSSPLFSSSMSSSLSRSSFTLFVNMYANTLDRTENHRRRG